MTKILVVEDEAKIARSVELELTHEGYEVDKVDNGRDAVDVALSNDYDLILLTARDAVMDKVAGLDAGADDYITKPFAIEELLARIRVALKRREVSQPVAEPATPAVAPQPAHHILAAKGVQLDVERHEVLVEGEPVELTNREFEVLKALLENLNIVMSRERLAQLACGYDFVGETNIIDVYIRHLRSKIDDRYGIKLISTVRGVGYVIREG